MAQIVETVAGDKRLRLGNFEEYCRTLGIGTNWYQLRLAIRLSLTPTTGNYRGQLNLGLCQGSTFPYGHPSCVDFVGVQVGNFSTGLSNTYIGGPPQGWQSDAPYGYTMTKIAGVPARTILPNSPYFWPGTGTNSRAMLCVDVWKLNPTLLAIHVGRTNSFANACSAMQQYYNFMAQIECEKLDGTYWVRDINYHTYAGSGLWDTVDIHWTGTSDPSIEISDIAVVRFA